MKHFWTLVFGVFPHIQFLIRSPSYFPSSSNRLHVRNVGNKRTPKVSAAYKPSRKRAQKTWRDTVTVTAWRNGLEPSDDTANYVQRTLPTCTLITETLHLTLPVSNHYGQENWTWNTSLQGLLGGVDVSMLASYSKGLQFDADCCQ
jgi:hypothetical protein